MRQHESWPGDLSASGDTRKRVGADVTDARKVVQQLLGAASSGPVVSAGGNIVWLLGCDTMVSQEL